MATDGTQANGDSASPAISADGRYVAFGSDASNLVPGDTNGTSDVFVRDLRSGTTQRVSVATDGTQANGDSDSPAISADGRYVAFASYASNLVPGDTNGTADVFVRDLRSGTTRRVSVATDGTQANGDSGSPAISADGRYVAFESDASNLVPGDTNHCVDVFVRDLKGAPPPPSNKFTVSRIKTEADGTITFSVRVPGPGSVDVLETAWKDNLARAPPAQPCCSSPPRKGSSSPANTVRVSPVAERDRDGHTQPAREACSSLIPATASYCGCGSATPQTAGATAPSASSGCTSPAPAQTTTP